MLNHLNVSSAGLTCSSPGSSTTEHNKRRLGAVELVHFFTVVPVTETPHGCREMVQQMETGAAFNKQVDVKQPAKSHPAQTNKLNFWTPTVEVEGLIARSNGAIGSDRRKMSLSYTFYCLKLLSFRFPDTFQKIWLFFFLVHWNFIRAKYVTSIGLIWPDWGSFWKKCKRRNISRDYSRCI